MGQLFSTGSLPTAPTIQNPYTTGTAQSATNTAQNANAQQQAFVNALQAQQGGANSQQQALNGLQGLGANNQGAVNQQQAASSLQGLGATSPGAANLQSTFGALQGVANGTGPNPAAAQLAQATGANTANQASLMAGQRGAGANVGLMGREIAQQGAANQQNAIGQAASLQANQSLGALGQMGSIAGQQAGNQLSALQGAGSLGTAQAGQQLGALQGAGSLAGQQVGQQQSALAQNQSANLAQQQAQLGALANQNQVQASQYGTQGGFQQSQNQLAGSTIGGLLGGLGTVGAALAKAAATGGEIKSSHIGNNPVLERQGPKSYLARSMQPGFTHDHMVSPKMAEGGKVPAMVSPGEVYLPKDEAKAAASGKVDPLAVGKKIPGEAKVRGDSLKNDTVPATLEEGGCVIPRSELESKDPHKAAAKFVADHISKMKSKK